MGAVGRGWIHVHVWLSPFAVPLKLPLHCQSAIPLCKIKSLSLKKEKNPKIIRERNTHLVLERRITKEQQGERAGSEEGVNAEVGL